jgi:hypothetical protein
MSSEPVVRCSEMRRTAERSLPLLDLPDDLVARPVRTFRTDDLGNDVTVKDRRGREKLEEIELIASSPRIDATIDGADRRFLLGANRRSWRTIVNRYGGEAWSAAIRFARDGAVRIRCTVEADLSLGSPLGWALTDEWAKFRMRQEREKSARSLAWRQRAEDAADAVKSLSRELAEAMRATPPSLKLEVLVHAAEDLLQGTVHPGPRAFSQAHFGATKRGPDPRDVLRGAGLDRQLLVALGIDRSAYVGVAGPVEARSRQKALDLSGLKGPVQLRADPELQLRLMRSAPLVILENLQAAEVAADNFPGVALVYTAGLLAQTTIGLISEIASAATSAAVIPDADLGGVRLAEQVVAAIPHIRVIDIGRLEHPKRSPWPSDGATARALERALDGPAGALAASCLERGYPVEQELATIHAIRVLHDGGQR